MSKRRELPPDYPPVHQEGFTRYMPIYLAIAICLAIVFAVINLAGSSGSATYLTAATNVVSETSFGQSTVVGTATTYARGDHSHGTPATPTYSLLGNIPISAFNSGTGANASTYWRGDNSWATITATVSDDDSSYLTIASAATIYQPLLPTGATNGWILTANGTTQAWTAPASTFNYMPSFVTAATSAINWSNGINQVIILSGTTSPFTFSGGTAGYTYNLDIVQSSSGTNYASWPTSTALTWSFGYLPTLTTTANATDSFTFIQRTATLMRAVGFSPDQK